MKQHLSITSRILVAFASGALIITFFLPAWRIDLFAPQYPEGLTMNIWINGLSGDVDVINGLNHYIGMKHITVAMFPEFKFLPYVVGFFILLGMMVAVTGKRKLLLAYLVLTVIGGALAMYDFYQWGYNYGHNLDPMAPIQVKGLSYQPPLLGHKRLLNFDAYSLPDVGGWVVIAAAALAFSVWLFEWYHHRRIPPHQKINIAKLAILVLFISYIAIGCTVKTEPFNYGKDNCHFCKMGIIDPKFGGELVTKKGKVYKFDDMICMIHFLRSGSLPTADIAKKVVIDYEKGSGFIASDQCFIVVSPQMKSPMGGNAGAFVSQQAAEKANTFNEGQIIRWEELYQKTP